MIKLNLHVLLAQYRISQKDLSDMTGIRPPTISAYCSNTFKHIVTSHLDKICYVLNCTPQDIIIYENTVPEGIDEAKRKDIFDKAYKNTPKYMIRADNGKIQDLSSFFNDEYTESQYKEQNQEDNKSYVYFTDERINKIKENLANQVNSQLENIISNQLKNLINIEHEAYDNHAKSQSEDKDKK